MQRQTKDRIASWGLGKVYALRSEVGDGYSYPIQFPVYLIDKAGYLLFKTKDDLDSSRFVVVSPRKDGRTLFPFTKGVGTGRCRISELPAYIVMDRHK
jgi:hypothetical protein